MSRISLVKTLTLRDKWYFAKLDQSGEVSLPDPTISKETGEGVETGQHPYTQTSSALMVNQSNSNLQVPNDDKRSALIQDRPNHRTTDEHGSCTSNSITLTNSAESNPK
jgi:hypothetical protein